VAGSAPKGTGPLSCREQVDRRDIMAIFMFGLAAALVVMIVGIGVAFSKDAMELIDFGYDPNDPSSGPRRM